MVKIIETNISLGNGNMIDTQSRVIELNSWNEYVESIKETKSIIKDCIIGSLYGATIPRNCKVSELEYTDHSLVCKIEDYKHEFTIKSAYLVKERLK